MATISYARTNGTTKAQAVIDCLEDALTRHGAYTKVATIFSNTSQPCSVWRCSGTRTALKRDWYLLIGRTVSTAPSTVSIGVAEGFDQGRNSVIRPAPGTGKSATMPAEDFSYGGGTPMQIWADAALNTTDVGFIDVSVSTTALDCWAIITNDTVSLAYSQVGSYNGTVIMAGVGEPFRDDDPGIVYIGSSRESGAVTRHPNIVTVGNSNWAISSFGDSRAIWTQRSGQLGVMGDRIHDSRPVGSRVLIAHTGRAQDTGILRGLVRNMLSIDTAAQIYMAGEKLFVGADVYQYPGDGPDLWLSTGAA